MHLLQQKDYRYALKPQVTERPRTAQKKKDVSAEYASETIEEELQFTNSIQCRQSTPAELEPFHRRRKGG